MLLPKGPLLFPKKIRSFNILRILHECSCFIEFIKQVDEEIRCEARILSLFRNKFTKFNNTGARMLDSIYHMTLKLL